MSDTVAGKQIKVALKHILKRHGHTYEDLAQGLGLSLPTVRRFMSKEDISIDRLAAICDWLGLTFFDLMRLAEQRRFQPTTLTLEQEDYFVRRPYVYTFLRRLASGLSPKEIGTKYRISEKSTSRYVTELESLGLVMKTGDGRVKLLVPWPAHWNFPGPLEKAFGVPLARSAVDTLMQRSGEHAAGNGKEFFFMMDSLRLDKATYQEMLKEQRDLYRKYNTIGRLQVKVLPIQEVQPCFSILGADVMDVMTKVMGEIIEFAD